MSLETAVDICPKRMNEADVEAPMPPRIEAMEEFGKIETVVDAEASMPPRIETSVEF